MQYSVAELPEKHNGGKFFEHVVKFYMKDDTTRYKDLLDYLTGQFGPKGEQWRIAKKRRYHQYHSYPEITVRFADKTAALCFKLGWDDEEIISTTSKFDAGTISKQMQKLILNSCWGTMSQQSTHNIFYTPQVPVKPFKFNFDEHTTIRFLDDEHTLHNWFEYHIPMTQRRKLAQEGHTIHTNIEELLKGKSDEGA